MNLAYFDCSSGIAGDMIIGALLDAGLSFDYLQQQLRFLKVDGYQLKIDKVKKAGFLATKFDVSVIEKQPHRHLAEIAQIIQNSELSPFVMKKSLFVFDRLAQAEATVHQTSKEKIHFHEVGAVDAIIDVVGCMIGLEKLGIEKVYSSPISQGTGTIMCDHGEIPIPAPASVELCKGFPIRMTNIEAELATPTGTALITTLADAFINIPNFKIQTLGQGAGGHDLGRRPNILRIFIGETLAENEQDEVLVVETNIDNMSPEVLAYVTDRLFQRGALDVFLTAISMKKNRPGQQVTVIVSESKLQDIMDILFTETTTIGIRMQRMERRKLVREIRTINMETGSVRVKISHWNEHIKISPEFDDCQKIALETGLPFHKVFDMAKDAAQKSL